MLFTCCLSLQDGETPLHCGAWNGHLNTCKLLLAAKAHVDVVNGVSIYVCVCVCVCVCVYSNSVFVHVLCICASVGGAREAYCSRRVCL